MPSSTQTAVHMNAVELQAPKQAQLVQTVRPEPAANEVLIEVKRAGICGTDIHIWHGDYGLSGFPLIPGHEFSGVVAAVGEGVQTVRVGERVTADPNLPCLTCIECQRRQFNQCHNLAAVGVTRAGAFATYVCVPEQVVFPIYDLSFAAAAMIEPLACVAWGLKRVHIEAGSSALLFGAGPMGCLVLQALRSVGITHLTVVDKSAARLELAANLGAHETVLADDFSRRDPSKYELVVDATGVPQVMANALNYVRPAGTFWIFGVAPDDATIAVSPYEVFQKDLTIVGSFAVNKTFQEAINLIQSGAVQVEPLISHVLPLASFAEALYIAEHDPARMKVQFAINAD